MIKEERKYYYSEGDYLQLREIKNFRWKSYFSALATVVGCLTAVLVVNHFLHDPIGIGYNTTGVLKQENQALQLKLDDLTKQMDELQTSLSHLNSQGDELRLLVDLPKIDPESKEGGFGGSRPADDQLFTADGASRKLQFASSALERLLSEARVQTQSYEQILKKYEFNKSYFASFPALKPMQGFYSVNSFGERIHPVLGLTRPHEGLDIINDVGTPVVASGDGTVEMAGQSGGGYGIVVLINHGFGYQTLYAHLSRVMVQEGQRVKRGQLIAKSGRTGLVSGPHLHYEVRLKGVCQNPVDYFLDDVSPKDFSTAVASRRTSD